MKLTVVAATGGIGSHLLAQALAGGHEVTAVVRRPERLPMSVPAAAVDLAAPNPTLLAGALAGADGVVSGLGPRSRGEDGIASAGTRALIAAMADTGVTRLVVVSVAGIGLRPDRRPGPDPGAGFFTRTVLGPLARARLREHYADIAAMHQLLRDSALDWTTVGCPLLTDRPGTGTWRSAVEAGVRGGWHISRADAAAAMLAALTDPDTFRHHLGIAS